MHELSLETIVARTAREMIRAIEAKRCYFCGKGHWRVITIIIDGSKPEKQALEITCAVQCNACKSLDRKQWDFTPIDYIQYLEGK